jgi:hypothetical protein
VKVILIGTSHPIQEGKEQKVEFEEYLIELCKQYDILTKSGLDPYPEIKDLPDELLKEYNDRMQKEHRMLREKVWLKKIKEYNQYPLLVTFGADHFEDFRDLLEANDIEVVKGDPKWGL